MFSHEGRPLCLARLAACRDQDFIECTAHKSPFGFAGLGGEVAMRIGSDGSLQEQEGFSAEDGDDAGDSVSLPAEGPVDSGFGLFEGLAGQEGKGSP